MPDLMTSKQLAEKLCISRSQITKLMRRKNDPLPGYKLGGLRFDPEQVEAWLERQATANV